ncbi:LOW QUALITY PROTEIN: hypothetical protein Cgig2_027124 [Carnegiea gigantea]|uniref:Aminotransferase-like plant mobile domain-containing protein n=1 Tax=Carnegiea gigantea TaxID=171969 RepID=A0A9Q1K8M4_9CARY|nr:LOW QUALITY PROTEIN: hypothetical protein Cgig2_027124 [Carnegiea gigantea]
MNLNVTAESELAAFLAFWLSRFILSHGKEVIRPETFVMATLMASGQQIFLAPMMLGYIRHGLREAASHPDHPGKADVIFPNHYVIDWLAELFRCLYCRRLDSDYPDCLVANFHYSQARRVFRDVRYLSLRASSYREDSRNIRDRSIINLAQALADLQRPDTGAKFYVSPSYYEGLAEREFLNSMSALRSMIDIYKISTIEICFIEDIFGVVETIAKIEELINVDRLCLTRISLVLLKITRIEELEAKEKEIFKGGGEDSPNARGFDHLTAKFEEKESGIDLVEAGFSKLQDLEKEKGPSQEYEWLWTEKEHQKDKLKILQKNFEKDLNNPYCGDPY